MQKGPLIINALCRKKTTGYISDIMKDYLSKCRARIGAAIRVMSRGCPLDKLLSASLWNITYVMVLIYLEGNKVSTCICK